MPGAFDQLVDALTPRLIPPRSVTAEEYAAITCNRCGVCCEDIRAPAGPEELAALSIDPSQSADRRRFLAGLVPVGPVAGGWRYRCRHFERDRDGLGLCTIHTDRPDICRGFPYGGVVRDWPQCAWNVIISDKHPAVSQRALPLFTTEKHDGQ